MMKEIKASMAGTVLNVLVSPGEHVAVGDTVVMLESMKMEIPIEATESGIVKEVKVDIADFVNEDNVLVIME